MKFPRRATVCWVLLALVGAHHLGMSGPLLRERVAADRARVALGPAAVQRGALWGGEMGRRVRDLELLLARAEPAGRGEQLLLIVPRGPHNPLHSSAVHVFFPGLVEVVELRAAGEEVALRRGLAAGAQRVAWLDERGRWNLRAL